MFGGLFPHVLDDKGRTSLPKGWRDLLSGHEPPRLTADRRCLIIYPADVFEARVRALVEASRNGVHAAKPLLRLLSGYGIPCPFDKQGRILIPKEHRDLAALEREIMFVGMYDCIEIWNRDLYDEEIAIVQKDFEELNEKVQPEIKEFKR
jgi:MraZ protein